MGRWRMGAREEVRATSWDNRFPGMLLKGKRQRQRTTHLQALKQT